MEQQLRVGVLSYNHYKMSMSKRPHPNGVLPHDIAVTFMHKPRNCSLYSNSLISLYCPTITQKHPSIVIQLLNSHALCVLETSTHKRLQNQLNTPSILRIGL
ncbi:hypothetical protein CDL12_24888 [Handroanthus impetiginosus]|uniref:Uncharacterized protein n=1 Tax=Handroanthus impetiginosus TaxID=429701 RepID=A0A2G9GBB9_9LAMI|nr:hypothetical protein CDL12_24888 [Handroanthus impetiginosus]